MISAPQLHMRVHARDLLTLVIEEERTEVVVRRTPALATNSLGLFGVEFVAMGPRFSELVAEVVSDGGKYDWRWYTSR